MALEISINQALAELPEGYIELPPAELVAKFNGRYGGPYKGGCTRLILVGDTIKAETLMVSNGREEVIRDISLPADCRTLGAILSYLIHLSA